MSETRESLIKREENDFDWSIEDLDEEMFEKLKEAQKVHLGGYLEIETLQKEMEDKKEKEKKSSRRKSQKASGRHTLNHDEINVEDEERKKEMNKGTERDERWNEVEFNVSFSNDWKVYLDLKMGKSRLSGRLTPLRLSHSLFRLISFIHQRIHSLNYPIYHQDIYLQFRPEEPNS